MQNARSQAGAWNRAFNRVCHTRPGESQNYALVANVPQRAFVIRRSVVRAFPRVTPSRMRLASPVVTSYATSTSHHVVYPYTYDVPQALSSSSARRPSAVM